MGFKMNKLMVNNTQHGFTMIELIIVIALIGILAVAAIPRFANMTTDAKVAARMAVVGSANSALAIAHAKWLSQGSTGTVTLDGAASAITMNASGYVDIGAAATYKDTATCTALMSNLLSSTDGLTIGYTAGCTLNNGYASAVTVNSTSAL
jgi:MSHA pilin protein MshA